MRKIVPEHLSFARQWTCGGSGDRDVNFVEKFFCIVVLFPQTISRLTCFESYHPIAYFCNPLFDGGLAQLARAFAWHAKGHRFDSGNLHSLNVCCPDDYREKGHRFDSGNLHSLNVSGLSLMAESVVQQN
jgi:hypothetical protein